MVIAFSGTHSTGKTTLLDSLKDDNDFKYAYHATAILPFFLMINNPRHTIKPFIMSISNPKEK